MGGKKFFVESREASLKPLKRNRLLAERPLPQDGEERGAVKGRGVKGTRVLPRSVTVNLAEAPLGWLRSRGLISSIQYEAGERLRRDWELAKLPPRVTMCWDAPPTGKVARGAPAAHDGTVTQIAARKRFEAAVAAAGPGLADVLWRTVCAGEGMRDIERALGWPVRAGKLVLSLALDRLARFYRMA